MHGEADHWNRYWMHAQNGPLDITDRKCTINIQHIESDISLLPGKSHKQRKVRISPSGRDLKQFSPEVTEKKKNLAYPARQALEKTLQNKLSKKQVVSRLFYILKIQYQIL